MRLPGVAICVALAVLSPLPSPAQSTRVKDLATGKFLVAARNLGDPNFTQSVVLLIHYDEKGAAGLIINRPMRIPLSRVFEEVKEAKGRSDPAYFGGPVDLGQVMALLRSSAKPAEDARPVFGDVYTVSSKTLLERTLAAGTASGEFRVFLGYAGWGAGQLEMEVRIGSWHIFRGRADVVFDPDPKSIWSRLIRQTEQQIAMAPQNRTR